MEGRKRRGLWKASARSEPLPVAVLYRTTLPFTNVASLRWPCPNMFTRISVLSPRDVHPVTWLKSALPELSFGVTCVTFPSSKRYRCPERVPTHKPSFPPVTQVGTSSEGKRPGLDCRHGKCARTSILPFVPTLVRVLAPASAT